MIQTTNATAGVSSFMTVIGKDLGLSATELGIVYTVLPMCVFLFKPLFGFLSDYMQNTKSIVICLITASVLLYIGTPFLEPIEEDMSSSTETYLQCSTNDKYYKKIPLNFNEPCATNLLFVNALSCNVSYKHPYHIEKNRIIAGVEARLSCNDSDANQHLKSVNTLKNTTNLNCVLILKGSFFKLKEICKENYPASDISITCNRQLEKCLAPVKEIEFYFTYQFWCFMLVTVLGFSCKFTAMSLTDVACYEILGEKREHYGRQRMWGTISTGIVTLLTGYLDDLFSEEHGKQGYLPGFYVMIALYILNMVTLLSMQFPKADLSRSILPDVMNLCKTKEFLIYAVAVFVIGSFSSFSASYLFWFLKDLGANQTLLGASVAVQCLVGEIPFFFFSGWIINHLGYFNCLTVTFASFALRFGLYSILQNPWLDLPLEILHGVTYAVFYASKTSFASKYAPPGTGGTVLGILGGLCDGLGRAVGSLVGGLGYSHFGGRQTFLLASWISIICIPFTFISHFAFKKKLSEELKTSDEQK